MPADSLYYSVALMAQFDGADGATAFIDDSAHGHSLIHVSGASIATGQSKHGGASGFFNGTTGRVVTPVHPSLNCGTGDFTVEFWMRYAGTSNSSPSILANGVGGWSPGACSIVVDHVWAAGKVAVGAYDHSTSALAVTGSTTISTDTWYHVAVTRVGTSLKLWLNGVEDGSATISSGLTFDWTPTSGACVGSDWPGSGGYFSGYIDDLRITRAARYTVAFSPPGPLGGPPARVSVGTDPDFNKVSLLLHCEGAEKSTNIIDSSPLEHLVSPFGNASISTANGVFGKPSLLFDGAGGYCTLPDTLALEFGASDLTLEFQINTTQTAAYVCPIGRDNGSFPDGAWAVLLNGNGSGSVQLWAASYSPGGPLLSTGTSASVNNGSWHHVAIVRNGSSWAMYIDGVSKATATWAGAITDVALPINLGRDPGYSRDFAGNLAQIRITKGLARYPAAFTPPSDVFPEAGNFTGEVEDASGAPAARVVLAIREDTGVVSSIGESDATTGEYTLGGGYIGPHAVIAYPAEGEALPALIHRSVWPV